MRRARLLVTLAILAAGAAGCGSGEDRAARADPAAPEANARDAADAGREPADAGFSVTIPAGWYRAEGPISNLTDPVERLVAATYPPRGGGPECGPLEFGGFEAGEVLVVLLERGRDRQSEWTDFPPRPEHFAFEPGMTSEFSSCLADKRGIPLKDHWFRFTDAGRHFHVLVVIGADAPAERAAEAYRILDSLRFDPDVQPDWRSAG